MAMHAAFVALEIPTDDLGDDNHRTALWNAAWDYAKAKWLGGRK